MLNGYFLAFLFICFLSLGISLGKHGQIKETKYNFWATLIAVCIEAFLVYKAIETGF